MKFTIVVDVDDVLNDLNRKTCEAFNRMYFTSMTEDDITSYDVYKCMQFEIANLYSALLYNNDVLKSLEPVEQSQWGIRYLVQQGFNVILATATKPSCFNTKVEWIKKNFPFIKTSDIVCVPSKNILKADVLIDDCPDQLISSLGCTRICFDKPWNKNMHDEVYDIHRAKTWEEIVSYVMNAYKSYQELMEG